MYVYVYFYPGLSQPVKGPRGGGPGGGEAGPGDPDPCNAREDGGRQCESILLCIYTYYFNGLYTQSPRAIGHRVNFTGVQAQISCKNFFFFYC